jgi:hypothetical protein
MGADTRAAASQLGAARMSPEVASGEQVTDLDVDVVMFVGSE